MSRITFFVIFNFLLNFLKLKILSNLAFFQFRHLILKNIHFENIYWRFAFCISKNMKILIIM